MSDLERKKCGRPKGSGGRPKGSKNKYSAAALRQAMNGDGQTPLEYLLGIMNDEEQDQRLRMDAAKAAAPFCHPRLSSIEVAAKPWDGDPNSITNDQLASIISGDAKDQVH